MKKVCLLSLLISGVYAKHSFSAKAENIIIGKLDNIEDWDVVGNGDFDKDGFNDVFIRDRMKGINFLWLMNKEHSVVNLEEEHSQTLKVLGLADTNADGNVDILWRDKGSGEMIVWEMAKHITDNKLMKRNDSKKYPSYGLDWDFLQFVDFDKNKKTDILWKNNTTQRIKLQVLDTSIDMGFVEGLKGWTASGRGDFNGNGYDDALFRNKVLGLNYLWLMNGSPVLKGIWLPKQTEFSWDIVGIGDMNNDKHVDIIWRNSISGDMKVWLMKKEQLLKIVKIASRSKNWKLKMLIDYNRDGRQDFLWANYETKEVEIQILDDIKINASAGLIRLNTFQQIKENDKKITVQVFRELESKGQVTVDYSLKHTASDTASAADYQEISGTIVFEEGVLTQSIPITLIDDKLKEPTESLTLTLSKPTGGAILGDNHSIILSILDDESFEEDNSLEPTVGVGFEKSQYTVQEDAGKLVVLLTRVGSSKETRIKVISIDGNATTGKDFKAVDQEIVFKVGESRKTLTIDLNNDIVAENEEQFSLQIESLDQLKLGTKVRATITLKDTDKITEPTPKEIAEQKAEADKLAKTEADKLAKIEADKLAKIEANKNKKKKGSGSMGYYFTLLFGLAIYRRKRKNDLKK
jgi:hypothetical protein